MQMQHLETNGSPISTLNKVVRFHRKQLRTLIGDKRDEHYKLKSNKQLYKETNTSPIIQRLVSMRWRTFGRILRLDNNAPCKQIMQQYFDMYQHPRQRYNGKSPNTIATTLINDIKYCNHPQFPTTFYLFKNNQFTNNLDTLATLARNTKLWDEFTTIITRGFMNMYNTKHITKQQLQEQEQLNENQTNNNDTNNDTQPFDEVNTVELTVDIDAEIEYVAPIETPLTPDSETETETIDGNRTESQQSQTSTRTYPITQPKRKTTKRRTRKPLRTYRQTRSQT